MKHFVAIHSTAECNMILSDVDYHRLRGLVDIIEEGLAIKFDFLEKQAKPKMNVVNMYGSPGVRYES